MSIFPFIILTVAIAIFAFILLNRAKPYPNIPYPKSKKPYFFIGHLPHVLNSTKMIENFYSFLEECGPVCQVIMPKMNLILISDPEAAKQIFAEKEIWRRDVGFKKSFEQVAKGILTMEIDDPMWRKHRFLLNPAFMIQNLRYEFEACLRLCSDLIKTISNSTEKLNVHELFSKYSLDIITQAGFNCDLNSVKQQGSLYESMAILSQGVYLRALLPEFYNYLPTSESKKFKQAKEYICKLFSTIIHTRATTPRKSTNADLLDLMMKPDEANGESLSEDEILNETILFLAAGHETTANTLSWIFYVLAKYPEWQIKLREEIDILFGKSDPTFEGINNLKIGSYIIKETMRMYPTVPIISKSSQKDTSILGYTVPAGTICSLVVSNINRNEQYWPKPEEFNPMRFDDENWQKHPFQYLPFGAGPQRCIGEKFALVETKVTLIKLVQNFEWSFATKEDSNSAGYFSVTYGLKNGLWLKFNTRKL